jgi:hypothetical protein
MEATEAREGRSGHPPLKRGIGRVLLLFFVIGDIVGAGIYALVGEVGAAVGGAIWAAFWPPSCSPSLPPPPTSSW